MRKKRQEEKGQKSGRKGAGKGAKRAETGRKIMNKL